MKKKKLIFILALFAVIWNSCFDDLPYSRRQERNQKTTDDAISLNAVKKYYSHIPLLTLPQTQDKAKGGHGMNDSIDTAYTLMRGSTSITHAACRIFKRVTLFLYGMKPENGRIQYPSI